MVADSPEIRRARELLASSDELLAKVRNRPRYHSSWLDEATDEQRRTVNVPVRKIREDAAVSRSMDPQTQAGWDRWAKSIARNVADERDMALVETIGRVVAEALAIRDERIDQLEERVANLEQQLMGKVSPIRSAA